MKSSFFSRSAHFGNVSPFLVGATNTFSELIHPLVKLFWNNSRTFYNLSEALGSFGFLIDPSSRSRHRLCCRTTTSTHFWSSTIYTTFHYIHYISQRTNAENCFRITGLQLQEQTKTRAILPRNQLRVYQIHKEGGAANRFLTARRHFWTPWSERTHCMENGQSVFFSRLTRPTDVWGSRASRASDSHATRYRFLYWFWEKNRLFCSLMRLAIGLILKCAWRLSAVRCQNSQKGVGKDRLQWTMKE